MQLRVARLCLDCEELHTENRCPRCISEHSAMRTMWLPVEERRRFRRPVRTAAPRRPGVLGLVDTVVRWINGGEVVDPPPGWATRREDYAAREFHDRRGERPLVDAHSAQSRVPAAGSD